jgi:hypothetical protein
MFMGVMGTVTGAVLVNKAGATPAFETNSLWNKSERFM